MDDLVALVLGVVREFLGEVIDVLEGQAKDFGVFVGGKCISVAALVVGGCGGRRWWWGGWW